MIKVAIVGYGNIGKYAVDALRAAPDMELAGIVRRPGSEAVHGIKTVSDVEELGHVDAALLCTPTRSVEETALPLLARGINTVDSFDIHGDIVALRRSLGAQAIKHDAVSIISAGWDPGTDSVIRTLMLAMAPKGQTLVVLAGVLISTAVSLLMAAPFVRRAATAEDMPTGAIPATQGGAPAVKAAQYFPAHIRKVVFACDAGMGSSALGATRFRKRLSDAGIGMVVGNCAADGIPADADVVVCQSVLAGRIAGAGHGAALVVIDNFLADPALDALFARLAQQDGADAIPRAGGLPAGTADAQPSDAGLRRVGDAPDRMAAPQPDDAAGRSSGEVLRPGNIRTGLPSEPKEAAIRRAGELLAAGGYVEPGYADAMLRREESATTYMGMGIAIPHGTSDAKKCVLHSGIVVLQYPGGVAFGNEKAYLVVGIAGVGDAHLDILARLGEVFGDEELLRRLTTEGDPQVIYEALK